MHSHRRLAVLTATVISSMLLTACGSSAVPDEQKRADSKGGAAEQGLIKRIFSEPEPLVVPAGTPIRVRTTTTLSTKQHKPGDSFQATLAEPLYVDKALIARSGAEVSGVVASSDPGGRVNGVATISVRLTGLETTGGFVDIATNSTGRSARTTKKKDAAKIGIASGIGAAIGAIAGGGKGAAIGAAAGGGAGTGVVLATRGEPAVLPAESMLTFRLRAPVRVQPAT